MVQELISSESDRYQELEQLFSSAYERLFTQLGVSSDEEAKNVVTQLMLLGVIEHSVIGERDYPAEAVGVAEKSWPKLIKLRSDAYEQGLDIVPERIKGFGDRVLSIQPKMVKDLPGRVNGSKVINQLSGDADDLEFTRFALEKFCPDAITERGENITKVA